jgi:hypothetical protein
MIGYYDEKKQPPSTRSRSSSRRRPSAPPRPAWPDAIHRDARGRPSRVPFEYTDTMTDQVQPKPEYKDPLAADTSKEVDVETPPVQDEDVLRPLRRPNRLGWIRFTGMHGNDRVEFHFNIPTLWIKKEWSRNIGTRWLVPTSRVWRCKWQT